MTVLDRPVGAEIADARSRARRRILKISLGLALALVVVIAISLSVGDYVIPLPDVAKTLVGQGSGGESLVILQLRLPRVLLGVGVGVGFALSGALFQSVLRNPLASPDIIGVTGGASAAAVLGLLVLGFGTVATSVAAFGGAVIVAAVIYLLAWRGGVAGYRFVLIGVGVSFMVEGVLGYLLTRSDLRSAQDALAWLVGSVSNASWPQILFIAVVIVVLSPITAVLAPRLRILQFGDDAALALGVRTERTRLVLILVAVVFAAAATSVAGPLAFVAFVSAPVARRIVGGGSLALVPAALVGALVTTIADLVAQHLLPGNLQLPAGIVTGIIGAPYLLWLLATSNRKGVEA
jgi:iron complex transport system permease protein